MRRADEHGVAMAERLLSGPPPAVASHHFGGPPPAQPVLAPQAQAREVQILNITPPPAPVQPEAAAPAPVATPPPNLLQVSVPNGVQRGQQIQFMTPAGQTLAVTAADDLPPGSVITVQLPAASAPPVAAPVAAPLASRPPLPSASPEEEDRRLMKLHWIVYGASWLCCCCVSPFFGFMIWMGLAANHYCRPAQQRAQQPLQRGPAQAGLCTALLCCCCGLLAMVGGGVFLAIHCGHDLEHCPKLHDKIEKWARHHMHDHGPWDRHSDHAYSVTLDGFGCPDGSGEDNNQVYFSGTLPDGRVYYEGSTKTEMYLYFDVNKECSKEAAWVLRYKPAKAAAKGCVPDAILASTDEDVPAGKRTWSVRCGGDKTFVNTTVTATVKKSHKHSDDPFEFNI